MRYAIVIAGDTLSYCDDLYDAAEHAGEFSKLPCYRDEFVAVEDTANCCETVYSIVTAR